MKRWQELLGRRDFLRLTGKAGLTVVVGSGAVSALGTAQAAGEATGGTAAAQPKSKAKSGGAGSRGTPTARNFLRASSPIDRTLGDATPREFFGDRNQRPHGALWDLKTYFATHKVEGSDEEAAVVVVGGGVSGLFTSYALRKHKPILLEQAARFGGNAKGQSWRGVDYSLGTAYIDQPHEGAPMHGLFHELGLGEILTKRDTVDPVEYQGKLYTGFWEGETDPSRKHQYAAMSKFFGEMVAEKERPFPFIPSVTAGNLESVRHYDQWDLHTLLSQVVGGKLPEQLETALEHYCWSTYAASAKEVSAAGALNFLAQESNPIHIGAGGNSAIAERVLERLVAELPTKNLRPSSLVVQVKVEGDRTLVTYEDAEGKLRRIRAKAVVMCCPKFVAARVLEGLEPERIAAIQRLRYRSYMTANLLLDRKMERTAYDVFMIKSGKTDLGNVREAQAKMNATDFIMANYAARDAKVNVFTFYRAFPVDGMRAELNTPGAYEDYRKRFETQIEKDILPLMKLEMGDVVDLRLALWGHALPLSEKGLYRTDTVQTLRKPFAKRVFFVEQDNWAYPSTQTGATESVLMKRDIEAVLGA